MNKRLALAVFLAVFLSSSMIEILFIVPVKSKPADIIVPDDYAKIQWAIGNASEGGTIFVKAGTYYEHVTIDKSISLTGENNYNIIIDGNGTGTVINIVANNVTVSNFIIQKGRIGIHLAESSSGNNISCNIVIENNWCGIQLGEVGEVEGSCNNNLSGNEVSSNHYGFYLSSSNNNVLAGNIVSNNDFGVHIDHSSNNALTGNVALSNLQNFGVFGSELIHFNNYVDTSNTVDGKPIYYLIDVVDDVLGAQTNAGTVYLINCNNMTLRDLILTKNAYGMFFWNTSNSKIENVTVLNNYQGHGICLECHSNNNTLTDNTALGNSKGVYLGGCNNNTFSGNEVSSNIHGIYLHYSHNNTVSGNIVSNNDYGLSICASSNNNILTGNNVSLNTCGIHLDKSCNNSIFHNNFIKYIEQVWIYESSNNNWDDGYPSGGNYWSDYTGVDVKRGPNQDQPSSDGIGDTAYVIDANNVDHYPLMYPWGSPPPPSCTLTIYSSPTGVTFTVDDVSRITPWSGTYNEGASVILVMPETHDGYVWSHWSDTDTNRIKTVTMDTNITLTGVYAPAPKPVGGKATPIDKVAVKPELQTPYIGLTILLAVAVMTVVYVKKRKRHTETIS